MPRLFKYLSVSGAKATLSTRSLRLSRPAHFNDPFDMRVDEVLGSDIRQFIEEQKRGLLDVILALDPANIRADKWGAQIRMMQEKLRTAPPEAIRQIRDDMAALSLEGMGYDFEKLNKRHDELITTVTNIMDWSGVYCMTARHDSLLMWSHYAQSHQGAVLEYAPAVNSALNTSRPVRYNKERPLIYRTSTEMADHALAASPKATAEIMMDNIIFTKSPEWAYEQEYRLAIPNFVRDDTGYAYLNLQPSELVGLYLGCRINSSDKDELIELARAANASVAIYQSSVAAREYALVFNTVS